MFGFGISTLISLFIGAAVIYAAILTVNAVVDWFKSRAALVNSDRANIAFTVKERLNNGDFALYQGIFNQRTEELLEGRKLVGEELDGQLAQMHGDKSMVVYQ